MIFSGGGLLVGSPVCAQGALEGLHRSSPAFSFFADTSGVNFCLRLGIRLSFPIQGFLFRVFHGSSGLHTGHGSGVAFLHSLGIRLRRFLGDWLIQAFSLEPVLG